MGGVCLIWPAAHGPLPPRGLLKEARACRWQLIFGGGSVCAFFLFHSPIVPPKRWVRRMCQGRERLRRPGAAPTSPPGRRPHRRHRRRRSRPPTACRPPGPSCRPPAAPPPPRRRRRRRLPGPRSPALGRRWGRVAVRGPLLRVESLFIPPAPPRAVCPDIWFPPIAHLFHGLGPFCLLDAHRSQAPVSE